MKKAILALPIVLVTLFVGASFAHAQTASTSTTTIQSSQSFSGSSGQLSPAMREAFYINNLKARIAELEQELAALLAS